MFDRSNYSVCVCLTKHDLSRPLQIKVGDGGERDGGMGGRAGDTELIDKLL